jgi:hypothetical protein
MKLRIGTGKGLNESKALLTPDCQSFSTVQMNVTPAKAGVQEIPTNSSLAFMQ